MIYLVIALILLFFFIFSIIYFFSVAFLRHDFKDIEDFDSKRNKFFGEYRQTVKECAKITAGIKYQSLYVRSFDGINLYGRYYNIDSNQTIILFHGYRSTGLRDFCCAVKMYMDFGFNVLLVDQRCHGKSRGKLITFGVKEKYDVKTWVNFVLKRFGKDNKILLGGMSMGATTVLLASSLNLPKNVKGIIADCGFTSPVDIIKKVGKQTLHINTGFIIFFLDIMCRLFGNFSLKADSTIESVKNTDIPILFIHGLQDDFVPCEMTKRAFANAKGKKDIILVDGADHGFSFLVDKDGVTEKLKKFILSLKLNIKTI